MEATLDSEFFKSAVEFNRELPALKWNNVLFPETRYITEGTSTLISGD
jgi:hypothetical protein